MMKTITEQKVFNFSSMLIAACLVVPTTIAQFIENNLTEGFLFGACSILFLFFIYWLNLKLEKLNGFLSSFTTTYISYTFLVVLFALVYIPFYLPLNYEHHFVLTALFLVYGYVFNLGISLIVYVLYQAIMFYKKRYQKILFE